MMEIRGDHTRPGTYSSPHSGMAESLKHAQLVVNFTCLKGEVALTMTWCDLLTLQT